MAEIANTLLISAIAFFVFLAAFLFVNPNAGGDAPATGDLPVSIQAIEVRWGRADTQGSEIPVQLTLANTGSDDARIVGVDYEVAMDGRVVARGDDGREADLDAGGESGVGFTARLGKGFAGAWWDGHAARAERGVMSITGHADVELGGKTYALPFSWSSTHEGGLAAAAAQAASNCADEAQQVCLDRATFAWQPSGGELVADLQVRNRAGEPLELESGTVRLLFLDQEVASGTLPAGELGTLAPSSTPARLRFSDPAIESWWPSHVAACEATGATLVVQMTVEGSGPRQSITWRFPFTYRTQYVCGAEA